MSLTSSLRFHILFFRDSIPIMLDTVKFFFFSVLYKLLRIDPSANSTFFSLASLPSPGGRTRKSCPYAKPNANGGVGDLGLHEFREPGPNDYRSPCPALNTMANHGLIISTYGRTYSPRDGKNLTGTNLTRGLMECYNLSWPLAAFLAWGGVLLLGQVGHLSLHDLSRHNRIEHDASLTHSNTEPGEEYAPARSDAGLFRALLDDAGGGTIGLRELARARVRRESESGAGMTSVQREIARGEVALVMQVFGGEGRAVPVDAIRAWWGGERLPEGWEPAAQTTLLGTIGWAAKIREAMREMRDAGLKDERDERARGAGAEVRLFDVPAQMHRHRDGSATPPTATGAFDSESTTSSSATSSPPPPTPTSIAPASPGEKKRGLHSQ
ncbi:Cloroperoxidase [Sanghuangporus baumii]|uniref:Cloroperoxidase n=1 Tax=Sanghuangporus baumii TaxID=108892 RepID=A0A9Q5NBE1_SANBA|nr:Cloroperoxidase [Sanghuangporus baumii]